MRYAGHESTYTVRAVRKAAAVLAEFDNVEQLTLAQLAERLGLPKATVFRLSHTLEVAGLLSRSEEGAYALGPALVANAQRLLAPGLVEAARPHMEDLAERFGHTVNLSTLQRDEVVFLDVVESRHAVRVVPAVGSREMVHATASGKAIAASVPEPDLERLLAEAPLRPYSPNTITTRARLVRELDKTRERGWAIDRGEMQVGSCCVAAAIIGRSGPPAALSVSFPRAAPGDEKDLDVIGRAVAQAARDVSLVLRAELDSSPA